MRDIAQSEPVKGKYFFLETDMKGPGLKLDNTGKAILTVCNFNHVFLFALRSLVSRMQLIDWADIPRCSVIWAEFKRPELDAIE